MKRVRGLTLVELMFAMGILLVGAMGVSAMYLNSSRLGDLNAQQQLASKEIVAQMSSIRAISKTGYGGQTQFGGIVAYLSESSNLQFDVEGLVPPEDSESVGQIVMYLDESYVPVELGADPDTASEVDGRLFGEMQIDTDASTLSDYSNAISDDTVGSIQLVPVEVSVTWQTDTGVVTMRRVMTVARMDEMRPQ